MSRILKFAVALVIMVGLVPRPVSAYTADTNPISGDYIDPDTNIYYEWDDFWGTLTPQGLSSIGLFVSIDVRMEDTENCTPPLPEYGEELCIDALAMVAGTWCVTIKYSYRYWSNRHSQYITVADDPVYSHCAGVLEQVTYLEFEDYQGQDDYCYFTAKIFVGDTLRDSDTINSSC